MMHASVKGAATDVERLVAESGLNERQILMIWRYLEGSTKFDAAVEAGYARGTAANAAWRSARVQAIMPKIMDRFMVGELAPLAMQTTARMIADDRTPAGARAQLILGVLDRAGFTAKRHDKQGGSNKDVAELTGAELQAQIQKLQQEIEGRMRDITPDGAPLTAQELDLFA